MKLKNSSFMTIRNIANHLEEIAPLKQAEDFDNVGLLIGNYTTKVTGVLVTLDTLEETIDEAITKNCNLIVSFHPIIFTGLKKINGNSYVERVVLKAIKNNIAIYATHTALDNSKVGVSAKMCEVLGLTNYSILLPKEDSTIGMGMIGDLPKPMLENDFLTFTKKTFKTADSLRSANPKVGPKGLRGMLDEKASNRRKADSLESALYLHKKYPNLTKLYYGKKSGYVEVKLKDQ